MPRDWIKSSLARKGTSRRDPTKPFRPTANPHRPPASDIVDALRSNHYIGRVARTVFHLHLIDISNFPSYRTLFYSIPLSLLWEVDRKSSC
jgi:hypothetical protein